MSIWSKVLVSIVLVLTLPLFYLTMRLLATNQAWRSNYNNWVQAAFDAENGRPPQPSVDKLEQDVREASVALHDVVVDRGRVWRNVAPERAFNANTGKGSVKIEEPAPHRIVPNMVVYVFDPQGLSGRIPGAGSRR